MNQAQHPERGPATPDVDLFRVAFDAKAEDWDLYSRAPLGRLRGELTLYYLGQHLASRAAPQSVLDAGAGTGSYALPLAAQGHRVSLLDVSGEMLVVARRNAADEDPGMEDRLEFRQAGAEEAPALFGPDCFDLVLCHTLLEYVPDPRGLLQALAYVLKPGGLLSLLAVNPHSDALRWALVKGDLAEARAALGQARSATTLFGVNRHVYTGQQIGEMLAQLGIETMAAYGVRIFADYVAADQLADPAFYARLWDLERDAGLLEPYAQIARYCLLIGRKPENS
jgi:S-adenosylmethionine-dependent methyltransferase